MKTWWHRLFFVLEVGLGFLGLAVFALLFYDNPNAVPWWGALVSLVPALLMLVLHSVVAYIVEG